MTIVILQVAIVILVSLVCGRLARMIEQAQVVGEMFGGILIGPSVFGRLAPDLSAQLFPADSLSSLELLSNIGLILFLFLIGSELDYEHLRRQKTTAAVSSLASIALPFGITFAIAPLLHSHLSSSGVPTLPFALLLGVSMSITAFPVLARVLEERNLQASPLGTIALMSAAVNDVAAWMLLAAAMTLVSSDIDGSTYFMRLLWLGVYLIVMFFVVRPLCRRLTARLANGPLSYGVLGVMLAMVFASSAATEAVGVLPLFGAFLAGLCFPRVAAWQQDLRNRLSTILSLVLLPLFFALTGLRTRLDLLNNSAAWLWTALIVLVAIVGKIGGAILGSRLTEQSWRFSFVLGALLNTRGLVELAVLNIAYNAHIFSPTLFTMLVVMALITTSMTEPLLTVLIGKRSLVGQQA